MTEFQWLYDQIQDVSDYVRTAYASNSGVSVQTKDDPSDLLTEVDLSVQRRLIEAIAASYPEDTIVAEESGYDRYPEPDTERVWIIDPIDGTQNFVRGFFPHFAVSVAYAEHGAPVCGIVASPVPEWTFAAQRGLPATQNGRAIAVSDTGTLAAAQIEADFCHVGVRPRLLDRFGALIAESGSLRSLGSAAMGLCAIASGHNDAYLNPGPKPWDIAAGILIVECAGGRVTDFAGRPVQLFESERGIVASNGRIHDAVLAQRDERGPA